MADEEKMIQITEKEYKQLLASDAKLRHLEGAGVDNWEGYDIAMESLQAEQAEES